MRLGSDIRIFWILLLLLSLALPLHGATVPTVAVSAPACADTPPLPPAVGVGIGFQLLLPTDAPDFVTPLAVYGPAFTIPLGDIFSIVSSGSFGGANDLAVILVDTDLRLSLRTPFLPWVFVLGGHYLHYSVAQNGHDFFGINLGPGVKFELGKSLEIQLAMKVYLQTYTMTSFGGTLVLRL